MLKDFSADLPKVVDDNLDGWKTALEEEGGDDAGVVPSGNVIRP